MPVSDDLKARIEQARVRAKTGASPPVDDAQKLEAMVNLKRDRLAANKEKMRTRKRKWADAKREASSLMGTAIILIIVLSMFAALPSSCGSTYDSGEYRAR